MQENETGPLFCTIFIHSHGIQGWNVRSETTTLSEESTSSEFLDIRHSDDFLDVTRKVKAIKVKNQQVGQHQTKNLLHREGNREQNEKATYPMGEKF